MTKQELKAKIDKLENGIKSKATPSNLIAPLKAQKAKFEKELEDMESAEKKAVKTKKVSKVAEKIKAAKTSVAKKTPAKAPAKEERKKDNIARDGDRKSLPSGKRISKSGKVYYETRANRSDKQTSKKPYLAKGGETDPMASVNEISRLTGLRPIAVAEWGDKNNINLSVVLKDLKSKKIKGMDLMTAVVGNPNNKYQKELLAKYSKSKMADGGEIDWGADLGGGFSVGNDVYITDSKSLFQGKTGFVSGSVGRDLLVTLMDNGNERSVVVSKKGVERLDAPEYAKGGTLNNPKFLEYYQVLDRWAHYRLTIEKGKEYYLPTESTIEKILANDIMFNDGKVDKSTHDKMNTLLVQQLKDLKMNAYPDYADGGKLPNGKYKYEKGDEGMFQGDEVRVVKYHNGDRTYEYNIIDEDGNVKTHGVAKAQKFENQFRYFPKMADGGETSGYSYGRLKGFESQDWEKMGREYAGSEWDNLSKNEKDGIISDLQKDWNKNTSFAHGGYVIFEGRDNYNDKPLYKVISKDEDNDYEGEFHDNREDAEKELNELKNKDMNYAKGGNTDALKKIKDYYVGAFPTDDLGQEINADATFNGLSMVLNDKGDVYEYLGVADSLVRERVFEKLSKIEGVSYDVIYNKWLDYDYAKGGYMADGGSMDVVNAEIYTIRRNIMGTTSFMMKIKGMRNPQDFSVYPISADQAGQPITIQSDTRFGFLDLSSGRGLMSQSHANGAYRHHFTMDKKVPFKISETDLQRLKDHISGTAGSSVGNMGISSDNSGASMMAYGGYMADGGELKSQNGKNYKEEFEGSNRWLEVDDEYSMTKSEHESEAFRANSRGDYELRDKHREISQKLSEEPIKMADGGEIEKYVVEKDKDGSYKILNTEKGMYIDQTFETKSSAESWKKEKDLQRERFGMESYFAKGGQVPAHFGSGKNIEVFGYETKNFDICGTAVKEFEAAVDIMKDSKELEKESLAYCAKYVDNLFGIEKVVVEGGIGGELNFSHAVSDIMSASTYNFRAGMAINLYSFVPQHLMEIALRLAKAEKGGLYALGGMTAGRWYKDKSGEEFKFIGRLDSGANKGRFLFSDGQKSVYKDLEEFEGGKPKETKLFGFFEEGGSVAEGNYEMLMSNIKAIKHHAEELSGAVTPDTEIEAWVLSKSERAETDLSDITHYLDGLKMEKGGYMADGGEIKVRNLDDDSVKSYSLKELLLRINEDNVDESNDYNESDWLEGFNETLEGQFYSLYDKNGNPLNKLSKGGYMADGGSIPNNYSFKTAKEVWEMWNFEQKNHFLLDHAEEIERAGFSPKGSWRSIAKNQSFNQLNDVVREKLTEHISEGQYAYGGYMAKGGKTEKKKFTAYTILNADEYGNRNSSIKMKPTKFYIVWYGNSYQLWHEQPHTINSRIIFDNDNDLMKAIDKVRYSTPNYVNYGLPQDQKFYKEFIVSEKFEYAKGGYMADSPKYKVGDKINHRWMGDGEVIKIINEDNFSGGYVVEFVKNKKGEYYNIDEWDILDNGMMAKGGDLTSIKEQYLQNEDENAHSENVVLLAKHFGTKEDLAKAKEILALHEKEGSLSSENGKKRQELNLKLIGKARAEMGKQGIEFEKGGYMAKGGIYSSDSLYILKVSKDGKEVGEERFRAKNAREAREMGEDYEEKYKSKFGGDLSFSVKEAESKMADGGELDSFEKKVKDAMKQTNKWHFITENVDGKDVQLKMFVGTKEVDVQIFKIDGIHARMPRNYSGKRDTLKMIMDNFESKMAKGGEVKVGDVYERKGFGKLKITKIDDGEVYFKYDNNDKEFSEGMYGAEGKIANKQWVKVDGKMAMGGKVKFADKVKSVQESLLKRKKVAPQVQKDYGKTYSKAEAKESAQRIVGSRMAQLKEKMAKKKK